MFLHVCRNPAELACAEELQTIAEAFAELSLCIHFEDTAGPFTPEALQYAVPDLTERSTWMSGPASLTDAVEHFWPVSYTHLDVYKRQRWRRAGGACAMCCAVRWCRRGAGPHSRVATSGAAAGGASSLQRKARRTGVGGLHCALSEPGQDRQNGRPIACETILQP